jgi:hypothetical protein
MKKLNIKKVSLGVLIFISTISLILSIFFYFKMNEEDALLDSLIEESFTSKNLYTLEDSVLAISNTIYNSTNGWVESDSMDWYSRWEALGFFKMSSGVGLKYKCYGVKGNLGDGPCGTMTKIFLRAMWKLNIPARKLQLMEVIPGKGGHTMAEFFMDGKWRVISPSDSSFVWRNPDGSIATVKDIQSDTAVFNQVYYKWRKNWQYGFKETWNINWEKIPAFLRSAIRFFIGEENYRNAETPELYENPRKLLFILFSSLTILLIAVGIFLYRKIYLSQESAKAG